MQPTDIIAVLVLVCFVYLKMAGIDSELDNIITIVIGYYFVNKIVNKPPQPGAPTV